MKHNILFLIKKIFSLLIFNLFVLSFVNAQDNIKEINEDTQDNAIIEKSFKQRISWKSAENVLEYKLVIEKIDSDFVKTFVTQNTYVDFSLGAGDYRYKVIALDFLGRESNSSEYKNFSIIKAQRPIIKLTEEKTLVAKNQNSKLQIPASIERITNESSIEIVNEQTLQSYKGSIETKKKSKEVTVKIPKLQEGKYYFIVKNPSGLTTKSEVFEITKENKKVYVSKYDEESEKIAKQEENTPKEKKPSVHRPISISLGAGVGAFLYDSYLTQIAKDSKMNFFVPIKMDILFLPIIQKKSMQGFELDFTFSNMQFKTFAKNVNFMSLNSKLNYVYRFNFSKDKIGINLKAGFGICAVSFESKKNYNNHDFQTEMPTKNYGYFVAGCGASVNVNLLKYLVFEVGTEFDNIFIPEFNIGMINVYASVGARF